MSINDSSGGLSGYSMLLSRITNDNPQLRARSRFIRSSSKRQPATVILAYSVKGCKMEHVTIVADFGGLERGKEDVAKQIEEEVVRAGHMTDYS